MLIGVDIDGCLADFNSAYIQRIIEVTGVNKFGDAPRHPDYPPVWSYPEKCHGYVGKQIKEVWRSIGKDDTFWANLDPLPGAEDAVRRLDEARLAGHEVYFITARPGRTAKYQTELWLLEMGMAVPTVLMCEDKATQMQALRLDAYLDDRLRNANMCMENVRMRASLSRVYLLHAPYNDRPVYEGEHPEDTIIPEEKLEEVRDPGLKVVKTVGEMLGEEGL